LCFKRDLIFLGINADQDSAVSRLIARLTNIENAIHQVKEIEMQFTNIGEVSLLSLEIENKHKHLMEISDWASFLSSENSRISEELNSIKSSRAYPLLRFAKKYGI